MHPGIDLPTVGAIILLSIPFAWDFSMHPVGPDKLQCFRVCLSIPFAWDFSMHLRKRACSSGNNSVYFQFPLLGIFLCTCNYYSPEYWLQLQLSIPFAWDFSMHRLRRIRRRRSRRYLSIPFAWDFSMHRHIQKHQHRRNRCLSIPFAWDFSMHPSAECLGAFSGHSLSIPFAWDFSMHHLAHACGTM